MNLILLDHEVAKTSPYVHHRPGTTTSRTALNGASGTESWALNFLPHAEGRGSGSHV